MMVKRRFAVAVVALVLGAVSLAACGGSGSSSGDSGSSSGDTTQSGNTEKITMVQEFTVASSLWTPWVVAENKGYFQKHGLEVEILPPPSAGGTAALLATGKAQLGFDTTIDVATSRSHGGKIKAIGSYGTENTCGIVSLPGEFSKDPTKLKGKTVAVSSDSWTDAQMHILLESAGMSQGDLNEVATSTDATPLMLQGKVDGMTDCANYAAIEAEILEGKKTEQMNFAENGAPNTPVWVLVGNEEWLEAHPEQAKEFMAAVKEGLSYAIANPGKSQEILLEQFPKAGELKFCEAWWESLIPGFGQKSSWFHQEESNWTELQEVMLKFNLIKTELPVSDYFTNQYVG
ncbi:MAG: ABC transporter substrate-binding protein [Solirubrobacterales bacterium]